MGDETNEANHTVVRVLNQQQTVTAQFLAFDPSVRGGVQVAAAQVGNETLIATAPFVLLAVLRQLPMLSLVR